MGVLQRIGIVYTVCSLIFLNTSPRQQVNLTVLILVGYYLLMTIVPVPTMREADGLACSSRNVRLTPQDRATAPVLNRALIRAEEMLLLGERSVSAIRKAVTEMLASEPLGLVEAVDIRDAATLAKISGQIAAPAVVLLTVKFGSVRLIDNRVIRP